MKSYDGYLFDADGTLMDTREMIAQAYYDLVVSLGLPPPTRQTIEDTTGLPMQEQIRQVIGRDHDDAFLARAEREYSDLILKGAEQHLTLFPGVREGLDHLRQAGKRLAVVTSRRRRSLGPFLEKLGILDLFDVLVTPEDTVTHKPLPEPALLAASRLDVPPGGCVFIGDALFDIECGQAAGMDTVLVTWGGMDPSAWPVKPGLIVDEFSQLLP